MSPLKKKKVKEQRINYEHKDIKDIFFFYFLSVCKRIESYVGLARNKRKNPCRIKNCVMSAWILVTSTDISRNLSLTDSTILFSSHELLVLDWHATKTVHIWMCVDTFLKKKKSLGKVLFISNFRGSTRC